MKLFLTKVFVLILNLAGILLFFGAFLPIWKDLSWLVFLCGLALLACSAYLDYHFWRCPYCGKYLGRRMVPAPSACPHCGKKLNPSDKVSLSVSQLQKKKTQSEEKL